ncbi:DUF58 domain-containing protein [Halobaculum sp. EA56]|uniref:DUF58 domain-containing protein n=1 Tax=Halobaculum sp. EA56 TaxID=3421648 RepID=UPI003EC0A3DD
MDFRRRAWGVLAMGGAVVTLGVLAERPVLLAAGISLTAWFVGRQAAALRIFRAVDETLTVDVTTARRVVTVDEDSRLTVSVRLSAPAPAPCMVTVRLPTGATGADLSDRTVRVAEGEQEAATTFSVSFPTAGEFAFPSPDVEVDPADGLFTETLPRGTTPTIRAEPRTPSDLHVGQGGEPLALSYGEHPTSRGQGGLTPEELRQYRPGDAADRIDWKATARHKELYVREFEAETDRRTMLVVDHRSRTDRGPAGATLFAYLREIALGFADGAEALSDPLGCWTVGDEGVTGRFSAASTATGYDRIRTHLRDLTPTDRSRGARKTIESGREALTPPAVAGAPSNGDAESNPGHRALVRPAVAAVKRDRLEGADSPFATRLRPFFDARVTYVQRLKGDPLFGAVQRLRATAGGTTLTVIVTDDGEREQLRETVRLATRDGGYAFVFLAPRVLFDTGDTSDFERRYERYVGFESFRRALDGLPRTTAFEVGPGDRLDRLLSARRR